MVRQVWIRPQWACGRRCHGPAGQMSLSGTGRGSQSPLSGQLHGWMSPREGRVWRKMREDRRKIGGEEEEKQERKYKEIVGEAGDRGMKKRRQRKQINMEMKEVNGEK